MVSAGVDLVEGVCLESFLPNSLIWEIIWGLWSLLIFGHWGRRLSRSVKLRVGERGHHTFREWGIIRESGRSRSHTWNSIGVHISLLCDTGVKIGILHVWVMVHPETAFGRIARIWSILRTRRVKTRIRGWKVGLGIRNIVIVVLGVALRFMWLFRWWDGWRSPGIWSIWVRLTGLTGLSVGVF